MATKDPIEQNILGVEQLISSGLNKTQQSVLEKEEGVSGDKTDVFSLNSSDEDLLIKSDQIEAKYRAYYGPIEKRQKAIKTYYLGRQKEGGSKVSEDGIPVTANLLFEAEETFLPVALSKNPEPVVYADNTEEGNVQSQAIKTTLQYHTDVLVLRRKLMLMTRHWSIYLIGILKSGWDKKVNDIYCDVRNPKNFIFDPEGYVDCYGDFVGLLGERITLTARELIKEFPEHEDLITVKVNNKLGTLVTYTEWWDDEYTFCRFQDVILSKNKNPNFNYDKEEVTEIDGEEIVDSIPGRNHFSIPKKPYTFLSVYSLQEQPHDLTSLIEQNIPNQRRITERTDQIDYNLGRSNNSTIFSKDNFNQEEAKQASTGMGKGHPILVPPGRPLKEAIDVIPAPGISDSFFKELETAKDDLRSVFGTQGITATQQDENQTARGMILNKQYDNSRIGGGIGGALEEVADNVFNYWTQLYYVHYTEPHYAAILGQMKAVEYVEISNTDLKKKLVVSVSPDSMKPKDEISEMNQALSLFEAKALDIKTLLTVLDFPDPQKTAAQVMLYNTNPQLYTQLNFPDISQLITSNVVAQQTGSISPVPQQPQPTVGGTDASAALNQVPLPAIPK